MVDFADMDLYSGRDPLQTVALLPRIDHLADFGLAFGAVQLVVVGLDGLHGQPIRVLDEVRSAAFLVVQESGEQHSPAGPAPERLGGRRVGRGRGVALHYKYNMSREQAELAAVFTEVRNGMQQCPLVEGKREGLGIVITDDADIIMGKLPIRRRTMA